MNASNARTRSVCALCTARLACLTSGLGPSELEAVEPSIRRSRTPRGDELAAEGEVAMRVRVIRSGSAFGLRLGVDGQSRPVAMTGRGAALGLFGLFGQPSPVAWVAATDCRICEIPMRVLADVAETHPAFSRHLASTAMALCGSLAAWSQAVRLRGTTNQLACVLLLLAQAQDSTCLELPTHVALADLLGARRETVARSLGVLEAEGGIHRDSGKHYAIETERLLERLRSTAPA
ncbi:Crp/Fnr family transcriptional regulator [Ramlibacter sp. AN1133]|uniref:Crp/Fnr family transcriptional regulator n=1 Tax=Ramlibacter sp. AN1133 TaxID=3133429 RepID=UPI0030BF0BE1